jgi:hypothetical protein
MHRSGRADHGFSHHRAPAPESVRVNTGQVSPARSMGACGANAQSPKRRSTDHRVTGRDESDARRLALVGRATYRDSIDVTLVALLAGKTLHVRKGTVVVVTTMVPDDIPQRFVHSGRHVLRVTANIEVRAGRQP